MTCRYAWDLIEVCCVRTFGGDRQLNGYRPEIDGLRAIAVGAVVLYHARVPYLTGGYVGVDVFFVISGYLITSIVARDIQAGAFSLWSFYERRIRRIFPALFVMLAVSTALATLILLADEMSAYARSLLAATTFASNFYFMGDTGYFAGPAESKPLLHTWSLAVEEQFYIVFPIYLFLAARYISRWVLPVTLLLLATSLLWCVLLTPVSPDAAFFASPTRAWELLAGSALALAARRTPLPALLAELAGLGGLALILASIFRFSDEIAFPGVYAVVPVVGTVLVITSTNANATVIGALLSTTPMRFLGLISYSLYLWHWPVLVFYRFWRIEHPPAAEIAVVVGVSVALAIMSWRIVERPFRRSSLIHNQRLVLGSGIASIGLGAICALGIIVNRGFPDRYPETVEKLLSVKAAPRHLDSCEVVERPRGIKFRMCGLGGDRNQRDADASFAVWGDSHAASLLPGFDDAAREAGLKGVFAGRGGCVPLIGVTQTKKGYETCAVLNNSIIEYFAAHPTIKHVILVSRWSIYAVGERFRGEHGQRVLIRDGKSETVNVRQNQFVFARGLGRTLEALDALGVHVSILSQTPETEYDVPTALARAEWLGRAVDLRPTVEQYDERQKLANSVFAVATSDEMVQLVDIRPALCDDNRCSIRDETLPLYRDASHLTPDAAKRFSPHLRRVLELVHAGTKSR